MHFLRATGVAWTSGARGHAGLDVSVVMTCVGLGCGLFA